MTGAGGGANRAIPLAVLARSWPPTSAWSSRLLAPSSLMMPAPPLPPRRLMGTTLEGVETWFIGPAALVLHPGDADNLRSNLAMQPPRIWVSLAEAHDPARVRIVTITADPFEGEAMATDPSLSVAALPMPPALCAHVAEFAALFPPGEPFRKKRRSGVEAEEVGSRRAPRILPGGFRPGPAVGRPRGPGKDDPR